MKKIHLTFLLGILFAHVLLAQNPEYKVAKSTGRLEIKELNKVVFESTPGNEIIFTAFKDDGDVDERARGLRSISASGLEDNTGIGLSVVEKGNIIEVQQLRKTEGPAVVIKVPKGVVISYTHTSPYGKEVQFKYIESEIEVSTVHSDVILNSVKGPMTVKTVHGDIECLMGQTITSPVSIVSVHGHVDVNLPPATKANMKMKTVYGEIFVDPAFKMEVERTNGDMVAYSSNDVNGKINGGGVDITLSSTHNNIYLRKR
ncbi:DUF4097 family beta strand repeat-containing protein [Dawidia soli]|uniref:DUF4097 family beta strand repeat protein n=1 Tax=Dawidia soli TaxID=2782352 RepID=A0AAP2DFK3_9BACT|nr:DUF4097 family beta strand repeat-containing protein [Dawidia soli]MBT1689785.1 DUF4097 family beta strand repeat protein [Dawidia soli]